MYSRNRFGTIRPLLFGCLTLLAAGWLSLNTTGCIPAPPNPDGGLRLCNKDADCPEVGGLKYLCVLNVCQITSNCEPKDEVCNGKDDDCDGVVDNVVFKGTDAECKVDGAKGPCAIGKKICKGGEIQCQQIVQPDAKETCGDKVDNNCNGVIDETPPCACTPGDKRECYPGDLTNICKTENGKYTCKGACKPGIQACNSNQKWDACVGAVLPKQETCNGKDDDCNGAIDDKLTGFGGKCFVANKKGPCEAGKEVCEGGKRVCKQVVQPKPEVCDGKADEDCDGKIDNGCNCKDGDKRSCYPAGIKGCDKVGENSYNCKGTCKTGVQVCSNGKFGACSGAVIASTKELCDGKDDDCDGQTDEGCKCKIGDTQDCGVDTGECKKGKQTCSGGQFGACVGEVKPAAEVCDGKDNNCDGKTDENFNVGQACSDGVGECKATGKFVCKTDKSGTVCDAKKGSPVTEKCNGKDDDCDGQVDNGFNLGQTCSAGQGECKTTGKIVCKSDGSAGCNAVPKTGTAEVCDGKDNDCDGKVDEDPVDSSKKLSQACFTGASGCTKNGASYTCKGLCAAGKQFCDSATAQYAGACVGEVKPTTEIPGNGKDEDCDGSDTPASSGACNNRQETQKWGTTMVACDCKTGETCNVKTTQGLCGTGWSVCTLSQWKARWGSTGSTKYRHLAMTQTCLAHATACYGGSLISLSDGNGKLCQKVTSKNCPNLTNKYVSFVVGPASKDCVGGASDVWPNWSEVKNNGFISRGVVYFNSEKDCEDKSNNHLDLSGTTVSGVMCCK